MARLTSLTVNDTGNLTLPSGTYANRDTINTTVVNFTTVASTTWTVPANVTSVEVLVVAGGGGGGRYGAGGGAGGLIYNPSYRVTAGESIPVTVGAGGAGHPGDAQNGGTATNGGNSRFGDLIAFGGGGGGNYNQGGATGAGAGASGGSGGGTGTNGNNAQRQLEQTMGGSPVLGQGNRGGMQATGYATGGGGGGGAGSGGEDAPPSGPGGRGGVGLEFDISGTPTYYAGGGGGGGNNGYATSLAIPGGKGGGGYGLSPSYSGTTSIIDGAANTGGGGGGGADNSVGGTTRAGNGGSGIVIIRYALTSAAENPLAQTRFNSATKAIEQYRANNKWIPGIVGENIVRNGLCLYYDALAYSGSGTTWYDLSGRNYHGTINGGPSYSASEGGYFNLDGVDDYISVPPAAFPSGREHTVEVWIKGTVNKTSSIVEARDSGANRAFNAHLTWSNSRVYYDSGTATNDRIERDAPQGDYYGWHHWVFTKDCEAPNKGSSTRGNMTIYRDGKLYHTGGGNNAPNASTIVNIGAYALASPSTFHQGPVSQVRFYNRALGADEVKRNYDATRARYGRVAPALVGLRGTIGSSPETAAPNARYIKELTGTTQNGFYWLKPGNQEPIWVYCDMNYDGGGWSLVMCNARAGQVTGIGGTNGIGNLTYYQSINHVWYNGNPDAGTYGNGSANFAGSHRLKFRCLIGLKYWPSLGLNIAQFCSTDAVTLSNTAAHTKRYRWSYTGFNSSFGFQGAAAGTDETGTGSPGMYSYHAANGYSWSTGDNGNPSNTCPSNYGNTPFWYGGCWSGNMYGGGNSGSYQDGPFWDSSGSDYHNYMAVYVKANPQ